MTPPQAGASDCVSHSYSFRVWYMNGNYLVILVSVTIILPLALMRQLGESAGSAGSGLGGDTQEARVSRLVPSLAGYLGYSSGFSLSCMVFFLIAVSHPPCWSGKSPKEVLCRGGGEGAEQGLSGRSRSEEEALLIVNMASE